MKTFTIEVNENENSCSQMTHFIIWNAATALSQLKLLVHSYFLYDNSNLPYAMAITCLYYVCYIVLYYFILSKLLPLRMVNKHNRKGGMSIQIVLTDLMQ